MTHDLWIFENQAYRQGYRRIAGVDEAGRGPLAGPVVSAAVVLPLGQALPKVTDSKKLSPGMRRRLYDQIYAKALAVGIGIVDPVEIDRLNILRASLMSMAQAVENLRPPPDFALIDGIHPLPSALPQRAVPKGDALSLSVAAASIVAKVTRDRLMDRYEHQFPGYGFSKHKGYPTKEHKDAIIRLGYTFIHRKTFRGVREHAGANPGNLS